MGASKALRFSDIRLGQIKSQQYSLTENIYKSFLSAFGDISPIHISDAYAREKGFKSKLMHGAILNGFISHFIGVSFPGKHALLQSVNIQYRSPVYLGDVLRVRCRVEHKSQATRTLSLGLKWQRVKSNKIVATATVQTGMTA